MFVDMDSKKNSKKPLLIICVEGFSQSIYQSSVSELRTKIDNNLCY